MFNKFFLNLSKAIQFLLSVVAPDPGGAGTNKLFVPLPQMLLFLIVITSFTSTLGWSLVIGSFHLFAFRVLLYLMWPLFLFKVLIMDGGWVNHSHIKVKSYLLFYVVWLAYALLSTMWAEDITAAAVNLIYLLTGFSVIFFLVYYFRSFHYLLSFYWLWLLIFIVLIFIAIWEMKTGHHLPLSNLYGEQGWYVYQPTAVFYNANDFATYIALTLPLLLAMMKYYSNFYSRFFGVLLYIVAVVVLIATLSRANVVALIITLSCFFLLSKPKTKMIALAIAIPLIIVFSGPIINKLSDAEKRISAISNLQVHRDLDASSSVRVNLMKNALHFTIESAGFGIGAGNAEYYMKKYKLYPTQGISNVHNWWLEILLNYGILIFTGYVILFVSLVWNLWLAYKKLKERAEKMICEALMIGLVGFTIGCISPSSIVGMSVQWIYFGFALTFLNYTRNQETVRNAQ